MIAGYDFIVINAALSYRYVVYGSYLLSIYGIQRMVCWLFIYFLFPFSMCIEFNLNFRFFGLLLIFAEYYKA